MIGGIDNQIQAAIKSVQQVEKDIRFAQMVAINRTVVRIQKLESANLQERLTIRSEWFTPGRAFGINAKFATKTNLMGIVGSRAPWLDLVEHGGEKKARSGGNVAIPTSDYKPEREIMQAAKKPRVILTDRQKLAKRQAELEFVRSSSRRGMSKEDRLRQHDAKAELRQVNAQLKRLDKIQRNTPLHNNKAFVATMPNGSEGIFRRVGEDRLPIKRLFSLEPYARLGPQLGFEELGGDLAGRLMDAEFEQVFKEAIAKYYK
jgi:hypothetical protein